MDSIRFYRPPGQVGEISGLSTSPPATSSNGQEKPSPKQQTAFLNRPTSSSRYGLGGSGNICSPSSLQNQENLGLKEDSKCRTTVVQTLRREVLDGLPPCAICTEGPKRYTTSSLEIEKAYTIGGTKVLNRDPSVATSTGMELKKNHPNHPWTRQIVANQSGFDCSKVIVLSDDDSDGDTPTALDTQSERSSSDEVREVPGDRMHPCDKPVLSDNHETVSTLQKRRNDIHYQKEEEELSTCVGRNSAEILPGSPTEVASDNISVGLREEGRDTLDHVETTPVLIVDRGEHLAPENPVENTIKETRLGRSRSPEPKEPDFVSRLLGGQRSQYAPLRSTSSSLFLDGQTQKKKRGRPADFLLRPYGEPPKRMRTGISPGNGTSNNATLSDQGSAIQQSGPPPVVPEDGQYLVKCLLDRRILKFGRRKFIEYLVEWEGYGPSHNSWVRERDIHHGLIKAFNASSL